MEDKSKDMTESTKRTYGGSQGIGWCRVLILTAGIWLLVWLLAAPVQAASFSKTAPVLKAKLDERSVTLSWNRRSGLTGYQVYGTNASGGARKLLRTLKGTGCVRTGLYRGKTYYYRVRGYRKVKGKTQYTRFSKVVKVTVPKSKTQEAASTSKSTLKKLLQTALKPVGSTMYVWGGGWNKADTGAGTEARTIGVSPKWKQFFQKQTSSYNYRTTKYQIANGLDCSGYVGWCVYNILNTTNGKAGYVMLAQKMAKNFASRGWGSYTARGAVRNYRAGDIMSSTCQDCGHVWIVVGSCSDGSVVMLHASPPGVQLSGTPSKTGRANSEAVKLASYYMKKYFPAWYKKYPNCAKESSYMSHYAQMRWDITGTKVMSDPDGYRNKNAKAILKDLLGD